MGTRFIYQRRFERLVDSRCKPLYTELSLTDEARKVQELKKGSGLVTFWPKTQDLAGDWRIRLCNIGVILATSGRDGSMTPHRIFKKRCPQWKRNYGIGEGEMLAVVESCRVYRQYLEGALYTVQVLTDHVSLNIFFALIYYCFPPKECWEPHHAAFCPKKR